MLPPPGKWSVQPPPWAALDFDNPLLKDVQHVATGSAAFLNRGKYNDSFRTSATPPVPVRQPTGISYNLTGSTGYLTTNAGGWVNAKTDWTVYVFGVPRSVSVVSAIATIAEAPGSGTRDRSIQINATGKVVGSTFDTANRAIVSTTSLVLNAPASAALRATSSALSVFVNGVNDATPVTLTASGFGTYASPEVVLGYGGSGTGFSPTLASQFDLSLAVWWSRALTDAEILSLHQNPWQVFKSPRRFIVPESGATAYVLDTTPGAYNITGSAATTLFDRITSVDPGAYNITGSDATTLFDRLTSVTSGAYNITGSDATTLFDRITSVTPGTYNITGNNATLLFDRITSVTSGTYNITGSDATTLFDRLTSVTSGAYNITGSDVTLLYEVPLTLVVTPGSYSITGSDVTFAYYALSVDPGAYNITGFDVRMDISAPIKGAQANLNARIEAIPTKAPNLTIPRPEYDVGQQMQFVNQLRLYFVGIDGATSSLAQITNTLSTLAWMDCN